MNFFKLPGKQETILFKHFQGALTEKETKGYRGGDVIAKTKKQKERKNNDEEYEWYLSLKS